MRMLLLRGQASARRGGCQTERVSKPQDRQQGLTAPRRPRGRTTVPGMLLCTETLPSTKQERGKPLHSDGGGMHLHCKKQQKTFSSYFMTTSKHP